MNNKYLFRNCSFRLIFLLLSFWPNMIIAQSTFRASVKTADKNGRITDYRATFTILSEEEATCALGDGIKCCLSAPSTHLYQVEVPPTVRNFPDPKEYTVVSIADNAFQPYTISDLSPEPFAYTNDWLKKLILPNTVKYIGSSEEGVTIEHLVLPNNLETIGDKAFLYNRLDTIIIPSSVREIGYRAFSGRCHCVIFEPNTNLRLSEGAFMWCTIETLTFKEPCNITLSAHAFEAAENEYLNLPIELEEIPPYCFFNMRNLKMLIIHEKVKKIGHEAFGLSDQCQPIIISDASEPCECDEDAFTDAFTLPRHDYFDGTLIVPDGSKEKYLNATGWNKITTIIEQHEAVGITNMMSGSKSKSMEAFNLSGRRVSALQKGIFILNGKKIFVK